MVNPLKCSPSSFQEENAYVYQNVIIRYIGCLIRIQLGNIFRTIHILFPKRFCYKYTDFGFLRNYLSWQSVLLVEESGLPGENHRPVAVIEYNPGDLVIHTDNVIEYNPGDLVIHTDCDKHVTYRPDIQKLQQILTK
jgi:hypothetical protein